MRTLIDVSLFVHTRRAWHGKQYFTPTTIVVAQSDRSLSLSLLLLLLLFLYHSLSPSLSFYLSFCLSLSLSISSPSLSLCPSSRSHLPSHSPNLSHSLTLSLFLSHSRSIFIWLSFSHSLSDCVSFSLSSPSSFLYLTSLFLACGFLGRRRSPASGRNFVRFVSPMPRQMYGLQRPRVLASSIRARTRLGAVFAHGQIGAPRERERGDFH